MKNNNKNSIIALSVVHFITVTLALSMLGAMPAFADISPAGCTGSGLGINLFSSVSQVHIGDAIAYSVDVFNGTNGGIIVCDASGIQASIVTPDGVSHPVTLVRTSLSNGQTDSYPNIVTYTSRIQDVKPDGTLTATASDTGIIHQNVVNSQGGSNQGLNVRVLNALHVIKQVVNTGGGTAVPADFTVHVKIGGVDIAGSPAVGIVAPGTPYSLFAGTYTVSENPNASYVPSFSGACNASGSVALLAGDDKTCTIINTFIPPAALHVVKLVVNTGGGTAVPSDFMVHVKNAGVDVAGSPAAGTAAPGTPYSLPAGTYVVSEDTNTSYTQSVSGACNAGGSVTLAPADNKTCTITNTFVPVPIAPLPTPATLHVIKLVVNGNGGTAVPSNFTVHVRSAGTDVAGSPAAGTAAPGTMYSLPAGTYAVSEDANASYVQSMSGACDAGGSVTLSSGNDSICTIINTDIPPPAAVVPTNTGGGGGTGRIVPLIGILKVPNPLSLPGGSGSVTYQYTVWNVGGAQALTDITVTDDKCSPVVFVTGDLNNNGKLDPGESWKYICTTTLSQTTTDTATAIGHSDDGFHQATIATAIATVVVTPAPGLPNTGLVPPLINIVKVPSRLTPFPFGGGDVTYTYVVTNPGLVPMHDVTVIDDKCAPVSRTSPDANGNNLLDPGESWAYACTTNVPVSTRDVATAEGMANGFTAIGYAFATVLVSAPGLPNTGLSPDGGSVAALALAFIIGLTSFAVILKKRKA